MSDSPPPSSKEPRVKQIIKDSKFVEAIGMQWIVNVPSSTLLAALALVGALVVVIAVVLITQTEIFQPGPTPTPTLAPADVYIAEINHENAPPDRRYALATPLERELRNELQAHNLDADIEVQVIPPLRSVSDAEVLASETEGRVLIWGTQDGGSITIRVFVISEDVEEVPGVDVLPLGESSLSADFQMFYEDVPDNLTFLSLFVIGALHYQSNEYALGYAAYNAAMDNLPENVTLANEALLHFFQARRLDMDGSDDVTTIVCEYVRAIELDPEFYEAYNNLANVLSHHDHLIGLDLPDEAFECLTAINPLPYGIRPAHLYNVVLEANPDLAIVRYNRALSQWNSFTDRQELVEDFQYVIEADPSIGGAFVALGGLALQEADYDTAFDYFMQALEQFPQDAKLHYNIGQIYLRRGDRAAAREALEQAEALAPEDGEIQLALANLAALEGETENAHAYLEAVVDDPDKFYVGNWPELMASVLRSRLQFETGDVDAAISTLAALDSDERPLGYQQFSMIRYWMALLYLLQGDDEQAEEAFQDTWPEAMVDTYLENITLDETWAVLSERCYVDVEPASTGGGGSMSGSSEGGSAAWGTPDVPCLPEDLTARILAVYDLFQEQLTNRFYYRYVPPDFGGMACPYVYTYDPVQESWAFETTILYRHVGPAQEATQTRRLANFDGRLLVREVEPETSYIDQITVRVMDGQGQLVELAASLDGLREIDGVYVIMEQNDGLLVAFPGFAAIREPQAAWVVATGYYVPYE